MISFKQKQLLEFIQWSINNLDRPPTYREMANHLEVSSDNSIYKHIKKLEQLGYICREYGDGGRALTKSIQIIKIT